MYYSFLIHLSADGHLGCFHVLVIIDSAVMNIGVQVSLSILVSFSPALDDPCDYIGPIQKKKQKNLLIIRLAN